MSQVSSPPAARADWGLAQWLCYLESLHPAEIELGLSRVNKVYQQLALDFSGQTVVTVAGTNGKGTTCAFVQQAALLQGKSVGTYSSPHLLDYRERVLVNGQKCSENAHCQAFIQVEQARADTPLTYFEFATLAALVLLAEANCELLLLEVGLGGRLDAVNVVEPDISVITSIDLDHQAWLGNTRDAVGREKAGILRASKPAVIGDPQPPQSVIEAVTTLGCQAHWQGRDFGVKTDSEHWQWYSSVQASSFNALPPTQIPMINASTALKVIQLLGWELSQSQVQQLCSNTRLPGRAQVWQQSPTVMLDVAHNPQACTYLRQQIDKFPYRRLYLVCGMLADKDSQASLQAFNGLSAHWFVAPLDTPRSATAEQLKAVLVGQQKVITCTDIATACQQALQQAASDDLIVVFGSFYTVAAVMAMQGEKK